MLYKKYIPNSIILESSFYIIAQNKNYHYKNIYEDIMKHIGIIAEYNPFHNGHAYQLYKAKELFPDKKLVVLMSGNYVQRGEPAIYNKYLRAACALSESADIVFELPLVYASASAEHFAHAAVLSFIKMGIVDTLCFGAEHDNLTLLQEIAHLLVKEPDNFKAILQQEMKNGNSFPKARMIAIRACIKHPDIAQIMYQPNNILAIEYLKAIEKLQANITPVIIKRTGNHYHDTDLTSNYQSATAIRNAIHNDINITELSIPMKSLQFLRESPFTRPIYISDLYHYMQYVIWHEKEHLADYFEVSTDLANQLSSMQLYPSSLDTLMDHLANKQYTNTRIRRSFMNILLGITKSEMSANKETGYIYYLRLLGFKKDTSFLLKDIKQQTTLPIINKVANAKNELSPWELSQFEKEIQRTHLYNQIFFNKYGIQIPSEYEHSVIISD